jgi:hypothetical protein
MNRWLQMERRMFDPAHPPEDWLTSRGAIVNSRTTKKVVPVLYEIPAFDALTTSRFFRINKLRDLKILSSSWFELMPANHAFIVIDLGRIFQAAVRI